MSVQDFVMQISSEALFLVILVSLPMLVTSLVVGILVAIFSATTQIQDQSLSFVVKMISVFMVMAAVGSWAGSTMIRFAARCMNGIVEVAF